MPLPDSSPKSITLLLLLVPYKTSSLCATVANCGQPRGISIRGLRTPATPSLIDTLGLRGLVAALLCCWTVWGIETTPALNGNLCGEDLGYWVRDLSGRVRAENCTQDWVLVPDLQRPYHSPAG